MNSTDKQYFDLLRRILKNGKQKTDRTGTGTISVFDHTMRFNMSEGFPLLTSKKMAWKSMVVELLWFLRGDTNIKWLVDNGCNIWVGDAYKKFKSDRDIMLSTKAPASEAKLKEYIDWYENVDSREKFIFKIKNDSLFAKKHGELGPVYGSQWRNWQQYTQVDPTNFLPTVVSHGIDQISDLIKNLKENPDSRRLIVNAWNVSDIDDMTLPPCHYVFQCYTRELTTSERLQYARTSGMCPKWGFEMLNGEMVPNKLTQDQHYDKYNVPKRALSLKWTQRSVDTFLGLPFNISSYGLLLHLLANEVNMIPEDLIFSGGDIHIYNNHIDSCKQQLKQSTFRLPNVKIANKSIFDITYQDIELINYESSPTIKGELSN